MASMLRVREQDVPLRGGTRLRRRSTGVASLWSVLAFLVLWGCAGVPSEDLKSYTDAYTSFGVRCIIGGHIPNNAGSLSVVRVSAPEGCIVNAPFPLAVAA